MQNVAHSTPRRNEGGRFSAKNQTAWYAEHEAANIARVEAMEAQAEVARLAQVVGAAVDAMPEAANSITKAATLVQNHQVWPMTSGSWLVGSQSDTQAAHLVHRAPWTCDCKHSQYRQTLCAHVMAVMLVVKMDTAYSPSHN
jgi:hypothetical protein